MTHVSTYTWAELKVSGAAFDEIERALRKAGWTHAFHDGDRVIDMHGIGLTRRPGGVVTEGLPRRWHVEDQPRLPPGTRFYVDGEEVGLVRAYDADEGWLRALCVGQKDGHPADKHLDPDTEDDVCEIVLWGEITVRIEEEGGGS